MVWVSSRGDLLALAGMLTTLLTYHYANGRWNRWYGVALGAFVFALASKEPAATVVGGLIGIHIANFLTVGITRKGIIESIKTLLPFLVILLLYFGLRQTLFATPFTVYLDTPPVELNNPAWREARITSLHYFFAPMRATLDEEHSSESNPLLILTLAPILIGFVLAFFHRGVRYMWVLGAVWGMSIIIPSLPSLFLGTIEGERLLYIPTAALALMVVSPLFILQRSQERSPTRPLQALYTISLLGILLLVAVSLPLLRERLYEWSQVGHSMEHLVYAIGRQAQDVPDGQTRVLIVPDNIEGILFARNGQGALVLPPFQEQDISNALLIYAPLDVCALPTDLAVTPYGYSCWDVRIDKFRSLDPATFDKEEWAEAWEFDD